MEEIAYQYCNYFKDQLQLETKEVLYNNCMVPLTSYIRQLVIDNFPHSVINNGNVASTTNVESNNAESLLDVEIHV